MQKVMSRVPARKKSKPKMGRPATGHDPSVSVRIPQEILDQVMRWAEKNNWSRSTAIVGLLEHGLNAVQEAAVRQLERKLR
jgi:hypothetical protein